MCGIAGAVLQPGERVDRGLLEAMTATLHHRGPDAGDVALPEPHVGLGHRRLSIIDLGGGAQPMRGASPDVWVTYNGEVFNYRELRAELAERGYAFRTQSDTEVLLALYELDGDAGLDRLEGQYAFAVWDGRGPGAGRLVLGRDPLGIKPLYYATTPRGFFFASEPRALLVHPELGRELDPFGLHLYLRYRFIPAPCTAWKDVRKMRPGERLVLEGGEARSTRKPLLAREDVEVEDDVDAAREELEQALHRAVESQRVADVPVGAFLSGGLDSSTTAALLAEHSEDPITTFTMGFDQERFDESAFAAEVARHIGSRHVQECMGADYAMESIHAILDHVDEPFGDASLVPTWMLCGMAAKHHKVVLSGDGGDELFGGYGRFYRALGILEWPVLLRPFHRSLRRFRKPQRDPSRWTSDDARVSREYLYQLSEVKGSDARALYGPRLAEELGQGSRTDPMREAVARFEGFPAFSRLLLADIEAHLADYHLVKVDRASMAHGLEVRVPLLDLALVRKAFRWTAAVRLHGGTSKGVLREAMRSRLPDTVMTRPKRGFGPPLGHWFQDGLVEFAREDLLGGAAVEGGWLRRPALERMLDPQRKRLKGKRIWRLLVLEHWLRRQKSPA